MRTSVRRRILWPDRSTVSRVEGHTLVLCPVVWRLGLLPRDTYVGEGFDCEVCGGIHYVIVLP